VAVRRALRAPAGSPERLVAQLHLSQWTAVFLAVQGAISLGLAINGQHLPGAALEAGAAMAWIAVALAAMRAPLPQSLHLLALAIGLHALFAFGHRPGWLQPDLAPAWFWAGQTMLDVYVATICSLCARSR
jgi:hypothetical protein